MSLKKKNILSGDDPMAIDEAVRTLKEDSLVAIPTETVYGLAARASSPNAIKKIFTIKGRPTEHPLILHIAKIQDLPLWSSELSNDAHVLAEKYWPGPLTLVVRRNNKVCDEITGGRDTVAIRCPSHPITTELLIRLGDAIVAPSANRFGKVSPTSALHVAEDFADEINVILDGGECSIGVESTIVDCTTNPPQILRAGAITAEKIQIECGITVASASGESRASGMLEKHYAPNCTVELVSDRKDAETRLSQLNKDGRSGEIIDFGADLEMYAHELYSRLRDADKRLVDVVIAVKPSMSGIGI
ncbi:MAG: L-threonylcarbamoyladenylate synthase, partial [Actinomycetota bacterium]|nr:L-threonylcarbamoyladenylate synthase [Actinomycetota bacterium]